MLTRGPLTGLALALGALTFAGCGTSSSPGGAPASSTSTSTATTVQSAATSSATPTVAAATAPVGTPAGPPPGGTVVTIRGGRFVPSHLVVIAGHPIHFQNVGPAPEGLEATAGARFTSGSLRPGAVFTWTPRRAGRVRCRSTRAPYGAATITVLRG